MIQRVVFLLVGYLACTELLARLHRTVLDPAGHPDLPLVALTGVALLLRFAVVFGLPLLLVSAVSRPRADRMYERHGPR